MDTEQALRLLASNIADHIQARADVLHGRKVDVPRLDRAAFEPAPQKVPELPLMACRHLDGIDVSSFTSPVRELLTEFRQLQRSFIWGHAPGYTEDNVGREFLDNYCHALVSGPEGPLRCGSPLGAFVLFGPDTLYREHSHRPNEVYLALTGGGQWRVGDYDWLTLQAGETIFIPSNAVHAIRAGHEPLLTFSFWLEEGAMEAIAI